MKFLLRLLSCFLPWPVRRILLNRFCGFRIHKTARIGLAWVFPKRLEMGEHTHIGHLTTVVHLDAVYLDAFARIGRGNWITGFPSGDARHFAHEPGRVSQLHLFDHSAITNRHLIDCTSPVELGRFSTLAGFQTQILSHSIDLQACRQSSASVSIGDYCFIGTNCVLLGGSRLPGFSVLAAKSLLNKNYSEEYVLYGGVPACRLKPLPREARYFQRKTGFVD